ncbi:MAG: biopolymer transporter ExbD [Marinobacter sp.]|nr:biopolymer transporter ExbD [Marinobacter sp.]
MQLVEPRPDRPLPIRITPLIDVVFILLVFFMLTSRLLPVDHLELANQTGNTSPTTGDPIPEVSVLADGSIKWQGKHYTLEELTAQFTAQNIQEVNVTTAANTPLSEFTRVLSTLNQTRTYSGNGEITAHWRRANAPENQP